MSYNPKYEPEVNGIKEKFEKMFYKPLTQKEHEELLARLKAMEAVVEAARSVGCTCEMRSGHPLVKSHSDTCKSLSEALAALDSLSGQKEG